MRDGLRVRSTPKRIPILVPNVPKYRSLKKYLKRVDSARIYSNFGPLNAELIFRLSKFLGVPERNIQTAANATLALEGAIRTSDESKLDWEMPSWTFAATAAAALNAGIAFRLIDVSENTWRASFSSDCKNIIDVLPFGDELDFGRLPREIETIVVDGAASFSALRNCGMPNSKKFGLVVSLHATKSLPAGEGAFFVSNCENWSQRFRQWTNFGFDNHRVAQIVGTNAKLSEYSAAIALSSLDYFDVSQRKLRIKQELAHRISKELGLEVHPAMSKGIITPYWIVKLPSDKLVNDCIQRCESQNIETRLWWGMGLHTHGAFRNIKMGSVPVTDMLSRQTLGMPLHSFLSNSDLKRIAQQLPNLKNGDC